MARFRSTKRAKELQRKAKHEAKEARKRERKEKAAEPVTRECPECLSLIPRKATRCAHCTASVKPQ